MVGYALSLTLHKHIDTLMLRTCMLEHVLFSVSTSLSLESAATIHHIANTPRSRFMSCTVK